MSTRRFARKSVRRTGGRMAYSKRAKSMVVRGYTQSSGLYGRFNRPQRYPESKCKDWFYSQNPTTGSQHQPVKTPGIAALLLSPLRMYDASAMAAGTSNTHLLEISQGSNIDQRIGRKIQVKSLEILGTVFLPPIYGQPSQSFSMMETHHMWIVIDTQTNGSQVGKESDIWQVTPWTGGLCDSLAFRNLGNSNRFRILKHIITPLVRDSSGVVLPLPSPTSQEGFIAGSGVQKQLNCFLKLDLPIEYSTGVADGGIATLRDNGIFIFTCSQPGQVTVFPGGEVSEADPAPSTLCHEAYSFRVRYTDV